MFAAAATLSLLALPLARAAVHEIIVGGPGKLAYTPSSVTAAVGDTLHFVFHQKNHTVTQSTFADPCKPMPGGFQSGFQPVPDTMTDGFPSCDWQVKTTDPLWVYCQQGNHCAAGMVFAVNAPATGNTFDAFVNAAKATAQQPPAGGDPYGGSGGGYGSSPPSPSASAPPSGSTPPAPSGSAAAPASSPNVIKVVVGGGTNLAFNPSRVDAKMGDIVSFEFHNKNHTATQSSFANPCTKLDAPITGTTAVFDSGYQPSNDQGPFPTYNVTVSTTSPLWFYCAQGAGAHCAAGMVFAINSVESSANNYAAFVAKAKGGSSTAGSSSSGGGTGGAMGRAAISVGSTMGVVGVALALLL